MALLLMSVMCAVAAPASAELRDSYTPVPVVALGEIAEPDQYLVLSAAPAPDDARAISLDHSNPQADFTEQMARQDLHLGGELRAALAEELLGKRMKVIPANGQKAHYRLDVAIPVNTVSYSDTPSDMGLLPGFVALVMVRDMRTGEVLARDRIVYGRTEIESAHMLDCDTRFHFSSEDALLADPKAAADGFRAGITAVAHEIATMMAR
jgi:hypothetical protein